MLVWLTCHAYLTAWCRGRLLWAVELCCQSCDELAGCDLSLCPGMLINLAASGVAMSDGGFDPSWQAISTPHIAWKPHRKSAKACQPEILNPLVYRVISPINLQHDCALAILHMVRSASPFKLRLPRAQPDFCQRQCKIWGLHSGHYEERRLLGYKNSVHTSQETHYVSATEISQLILCKIWSFHGADYEECLLLIYKNPVRTSQETHYVSNIESSQLMLCKIWGFHGADHEECRLLGIKIPVLISQETNCVSVTESSQLMLCKIWGFYGGDYEECRLLGYKTQFVPIGDTLHLCSSAKTVNAM
jgi:hypothetical protein